MKTNNSQSDSPATGMVQKYVRLLSYVNALKVIDFVNSNDKNDYANIVSGGVSISASEKNWNKIEDFLYSLKIKFELGYETPDKVTKKIISDLKSMGQKNTEINDQLLISNSLKSEIELLADNYRIKIRNAGMVISELKDKRSHEDIEKEERLKIKQSVYKTFVAELERIIRNTK